MIGNAASHLPGAGTWSPGQRFLILCNLLRYKTYHYMVTVMKMEGPGKPMSLIVARRQDHV